MSRRPALWVLGLCLMNAAAAPTWAQVRGEEVMYADGQVSMNGYLAYADGIEGPRPGVLVVHEWWGHNAYARARARMLAELGYTALAVDMYGDGKTAEHPDDAGAFSSAVMQNLTVARGRFQAALDVLRDYPTTDPDRVAAIGYCFGGGVVLQMARDGLDLDGVVSFHGSLATNSPARRGHVKAKILVCHGAEDQLVSDVQIQTFHNEMKAARVDYHFVYYLGAMHSFTNKQADELAQRFGLPLGYSARADTQSWRDMKEFLADVFAD